MKTRKRNSAKAHSYVRMTFSLPQEIGAEIAKIPAQKRSKEIVAILEEEFKRRRFLQSLDEFYEEPPVVPARHKWSKIRSRSIDTDIFSHKK